MASRMITFGAAFVLGLGTMAQAGLVAHEGFESYEAGAALAGLNGGSSGWTSAWVSNATVGTVDIAQRNLNAGGHDGASQALRLDGTGAAGYAISRSFDRITGPFDGDNAAYASVLFRAHSLGGNEFINLYFSDGLISSGDANEMAGGGVHLNPSGMFFTRYGSSASGVTTVTSTSALNPVQDFLIVLKVTKTQNQFYNRIDMWLFDANSLASASESSPTATALHPVGSNMNGISRINLRTLNLVEGESLFLDEIRIGTTWSAVVIPEPNTAALLLLGGLATLRRRKMA